MKISISGSLFKSGNRYRNSYQQVKLTFRIPARKVEKLRKNKKELVSDGYSTYRDFARLAGFVISLSLAVGPIARLFTRQMHYAIQSRPYLEAIFEFSDPLLQELKFWLQNIDSIQWFLISASCFCFLEVILLLWITFQLVVCFRRVKILIIHTIQSYAE